MSDCNVAAANALQRAIQFLLDVRQPADDGLREARRERKEPRYWKDFRVFGRSSDEWVTAYTAAALTETGVSEAHDAADEAWRFLTARRREVRGGLGYNRETPCDGDSTQWGCRLSVLLGRTSDDWFRSALEFLVGPQNVDPEPDFGGGAARPIEADSRQTCEPAASTCLRSDGGVATYPSADSLRAVIRNYTGGATKGWTSSHVCVTAAAAWLKEILAVGDVPGFLTRAQSSSGCWESYWWVDREYATAHAVESLSRHQLQRESIERGVYWLSRCPPGASSFRLALRILGTCAAGSGRVDALLPELLEQQLGDGSWASSAYLRIPPLDLCDPEIRWNWDETSDGFGGIVVDRARVFTTATAVRALTSCLAL